jgi:hypothetical protein
MLMLAGTSAALPLAACSGLSLDNLFAGIPQYVSLAQSALNLVPSVLSELPTFGVPAATLSKATSILTQVQSGLAAISGAASASAGASYLATVETYINTLAQLIGPYVVAAASAVPGVGTIVGLLFAFLPEIEAAINFGISQLTPLATQIAATAKAA